jgi:hypothetical protein
MGQQASNCAPPSRLNSAIVERQPSTMAKLEAALGDKGQTLARSAEAHRAELKAAGGTWRSRFLRASEYVAGRLVAGVLVR